MVFSPKFERVFPCKKSCVAYVYIPSNDPNKWYESLIVDGRKHKQDDFSKLHKLFSMQGEDGRSSLC